MTETRFKNTPWKVYANDFTNAWISNSEDVTVALAFKDSVEHAHLIAAAPELYEALEAAANSSGFQYMFSETRDKINTALAKARGEV